MLQQHHNLWQILQDPLFDEKGLETTVLRTDLLHPVISGNKWMKLQPWIRQAIQHNDHAIITKGGPWSNHLHAVAFSAQQEQLAFTAVVKAKAGFMTPTLNDILQWKGNIIYTDHAQYEDEAYWENLAFVQDALYIPMGGEGEVAVKGVSDFFNALRATDYDYVLCPLGTGTTYKGVAQSLLSYQHLLGFDPGIRDDNYGVIIDELRNKFPGKNFGQLFQHSLKKFGHWPGFLPIAMNEWFAKWQLPTDIVYTAKMVYHTLELVQQGYFTAGSRLLLIHTGGLQGNRSLPAGFLTY